MPVRHLLLSLFGTAAAIVLAGAGCGRVAQNAPRVGGESHFLRWCDSSCEEEGLECISGLCTQPCVVAEPNACAAFSGASCTDRSIEPGAVAVCDVSCARNDDCAPLGSDYSCDGSFCRASKLPRGQSSGPAGTDAGSTPDTSCVECLEVGSLSWRWDGTLAGVGPSSYLAGCNRYQHMLVPSGADDPLGSPMCATSVDACPSRDLSVLNEILRSPEVQAGLQAHTVFGLDGRAGDGQVRQVTVGTNSFFVGAPCASGSADCVAIPAVVDSLIVQLRALDALELSKESCASVFPDGWVF